MPIESLQSLTKLTHLTNAVKRWRNDDTRFPLPRRLVEDIKYESELPHEIFLDRWFGSPPPRSKALYYWGGSGPHGPGSRKCLDVKRRIPADSSVLYLSEWNTKKCKEALGAYDFIIYFQSDFSSRDEIKDFLMRNIYARHLQSPRSMSKAGVIILSNYSPETFFGWILDGRFFTSLWLVYVVRHEECTSSSDALLDSWFLNPGDKVLYVWSDQDYPEEDFDYCIYIKFILRRLLCRTELKRITPSYVVYIPEITNRYLNSSDPYKYLMVIRFIRNSPQQFLSEYFFGDLPQTRPGINLIMIAKEDPKLIEQLYPNRIYAVKV